MVRYRPVWALRLGHLLRLLCLLGQSYDGAEPPTHSAPDRIMLFGTLPRAYERLGYVKLHDFRLLSRIIGLLVRSIP